MRVSTFQRFGSFLPLYLFVVLFSFSSCQKEKLPSVITHAASEVTSVSAVVAGDVVSDGGASVTVRGFAWGTDPQPEVSNNKTEAGEGTGFFKTTITGLASGTKYYVRAYAGNTAGISYGNEISFTTRESDPVGTGEIILGPNSKIVLGVPVLSEVELVSTVYNNGPASLNYLRFYNLYPISRVNQEVLEVRFFPAGGELLTDDRGQSLMYHGFTSLATGVSRITGWRAKVKTWSLTYQISPDDVGTLNEIPQAIATEYLADNDLYQITNPIVIGARDAALKGETHPLEMAKKIFSWVQNHMSYVTGLGWADAPTNITRKQGTCSDYAFVFISMCRSAGLPARWTGAVVRRGEQNSPGPHFDEPHHRWAQVYLPKIGWVEANVQGGKWGFLGDKYLIISEASGPSNYMDTRYESIRRWSFNGTGTLTMERYSLWWPVISTSGNKPGVPVLASPADNSVNIPESTPLAWNEVAMATSYRVEISRYSDFSLLQYYKGDVKSLSYLPQWTATPGVKWYWRVSASNIAGTSDWSASRSFTR